MSHDTRVFATQKAVQPPGAPKDPVHRVVDMGKDQFKVLAAKIPMFEHGVEVTISGVKKRIGGQGTALGKATAAWAKKNETSRPVWTKLFTGPIVMETLAAIGCVHAKDVHGQTTLACNTHPIKPLPLLSVLVHAMAGGVSVDFNKYYDSSSGLFGVPKDVLERVAGMAHAEWIARPAPGNMGPPASTTLPSQSTSQTGTDDDKAADDKEAQEAAATIAAVEKQEEERRAREAAAAKEKADDEKAEKKAREADAALARQIKELTAKRAKGQAEQETRRSKKKAKANDTIDMSEDPDGELGGGELAALKARLAVFDQAIVLRDIQDEYRKQELQAMRQQANDQMIRRAMGVSKQEASEEELMSRAANFTGLHKKYIQHVVAAAAVIGQALGRHQEGTEVRKGHAQGGGGGRRGGQQETAMTILSTHHIVHT